MSDGDPRLEAIADRVGRNVLALAAVVRVLAVAGAVTGAAAFLALLPWVLRLPPTGAAVVALLLLLAVAVPPVVLLRHREDLVAAYGDGELLEEQVLELGTGAQDAYRRLLELEAARPEGRFGRIRWAWPYLEHVRSIWKSGFGTQFRKLADPIEPTRLARSATCGLWSVGTSILAAPIVLLSLLAWRFLG